MDADAWVVDGFGVAHPVAEKTAIGRIHEGELVVLAASVSREHAELRRTDAGWQIRDLGSSAAEPLNTRPECLGAMS